MLIHQILRCALHARIERQRMMCHFRYLIEYDCIIYCICRRSAPRKRARDLTAEEINLDYERNTGVVIIETIGDKDPLEVPGIDPVPHNF